MTLVTSRTGGNAVALAAWAIGDTREISKTIARARIEGAGEGGEEGNYVAALHGWVRSFQLSLRQGIDRKWTLGSL